MSDRTVKVSNLSLGATLQDIEEFFVFCGEIEYVEMESFDEWSQIAYVTFKESQGAETAILLSGSTIVDLTVTIELDPDYQLPLAASPPHLEPENITPVGAESAFRKAEDVVCAMLAKGFVLGKDAINKARSFDEKHQLTSTVSSLDKKIGFTEKISAGTSMVNDKVREVDQKLQVSEKAKSAGSALMRNMSIFKGVAWAVGAFSRVTKTADEVGQHTKEKVAISEKEQMMKTAADDYVKVHLADESSEQAQQKTKKQAMAQGFIH